MAIIYNGTKITAIKYNGTVIQKVIMDGETIFCVSCTTSTSSCGAICKTSVSKTVKPCGAIPCSGNFSETFVEA